MKLQILISTMHQDNHNILKKMNVSSDAIIVNQCNVNKLERFDFNGHDIQFMSLAERGVGLSRNTALMRATADICLFADDDCVYVDDYEKIILDAFSQHKDADMIFFNVVTENGYNADYIIKETNKINFFNGLRFGACRTAIKREKIFKENIYFSLLFGGGARYSSGEDSLFIFDCLKHKLNIYEVPVYIGKADQSTSTWFKGYTEKYFFDKGVLFAALLPNWSYLLCLQFLLRHSECYKGKFSFLEVLNIMIKGAKTYKQV